MSGKIKIIKRGTMILDLVETKFYKKALNSIENRLFSKKFKSWIF